MLILEKAFAKLFGSYDNIELGMENQALMCLARAPTKAILHNESPNVIDQIFEGEDKNYIMCSGSNLSDQGIEA